MSGKAPESLTPPAMSRELARRAGAAGLATIGPDGAPFATLAAAAAAMDGAPVLLLSDLARHSRNLAADPRAALLFTSPADGDDPLAGARVTLSGPLRPDADPGLRRRFLARHPEAAGYAGFADFRIYRMAVAEAHLVAGFGGGKAIPAADYLLDCADLAAAEPTLLARINEGVILAAGPGAAKDSAAGGQIAALDPEGFDIIRSAAWRRLTFNKPIFFGDGIVQAVISLLAGS